jgi:hypothetical protein
MKPDVDEHDRGLRRVDALLKALRPEPPAAETLLDVRRALTRETRREPVPEIMTLEDVAAFLQLSEEELGEIVEFLPAFELAGQIRVRRSQLIAWIEERERQYRATTGWATPALVS